jgi:hypothetical protein
MKPEPKFKPIHPEGAHYDHDCDACTFLGTWRGDAKHGAGIHDHDLYYCGGRWPTVIARCSSEGSDYMSGIVFRTHNPAIEEGCKRAEALGLNLKRGD